MDVAEHKRQEQTHPECRREEGWRPELPLRCLVVNRKAPKMIPQNPPRSAMMWSVLSLILSQPMTARSLSRPIAKIPEIPASITHLSMKDWVRRSGSATLR